MENNPNYIRDMVHVALKLGEVTGVPMLLMSNPGLGKTSMFASWCNLNNYKLTTLIGSQRTAEEILGYMVNETVKHMKTTSDGYDIYDESNLTTAVPDWYKDIMDNKKAGYKTALFIDELSTASEFVQGAMLQLIFSRKVGGRDNMLPDDTLIIAAANYKDNLPAMNTIMAPTLNRFCIVNLEPVDSMSLIDEFLQSDSSMNRDTIVFGNTNITLELENNFRKYLKNNLKMLVETYSRDELIIDIKNKNFNEIYDNKGAIYNFMSGRTISYLFRIGLGLIKIDVCKNKYKHIIDNIILGLIGSGTNSFSNEADAESWRASCVSQVKKAINESIKSVPGEEVIIDYKNLSISDSISKWMNVVESTKCLNMNTEGLVEKIRNEYPRDAQGIKLVLTSINSKKKAEKFLSDFLKIKDFISVMKTDNSKALNAFVTRMEIVESTYKLYVNQILNYIVGG